ncbi:unnamed protein product [Amoebophrya sp. A25]|nr:unnamed protein product [Amoebophrya sp. A25]|eukprot:GSA25T00028016001.1
MRCMCQRILHTPGEEQILDTGLPTKTTSSKKYFLLANLAKLSVLVLHGARE